MNLAAIWKSSLPEGIQFLNDHDWSDRLVQFVHDELAQYPGSYWIVLELSLDEIAELRKATPRLTMSGTS